MLTQSQELLPVFALRTFNFGFFNLLTAALHAAVVAVVAPPLLTTAAAPYSSYFSGLRLGLPARLGFLCASTANVTLAQRGAWLITVTHRTACGPA